MKNSVVFMTVVVCMLSITKACVFDSSCGPNGYCCWFCSGHPHGSMSCWKLSPIRIGSISSLPEMDSQTKELFMLERSILQDLGWVETNGNETSDKPFSERLQQLFEHPMFRKIDPTSAHIMGGLLRANIPRNTVTAE